MSTIFFNLNFGLYSLVTLPPLLYLVATPRACR